MHHMHHMHPFEWASPGVLLPLGGHCVEGLASGASMSGCCGKLLHLCCARLSSTPAALAQSNGSPMAIKHACDSVHATPTVSVPEGGDHFTSRQARVRGGHTKLFQFTLPVSPLPHSCATPCAHACVLYWCPVRTNGTDIRVCTDMRISLHTHTYTGQAHKHRPHSHTHNRCAQ